MNAANNLDTVLEYLRQLSTQHFYGAINVKFHAGKIIHLSKQESLLPETIHTTLTTSEEETTLRSNNDNTHTYKQSHQQ